MFRVHVGNINELREHSILSQFQAGANSLIETYDYNDIKKAIKYAKSKVEKVTPKTFDESMIVIRELFIETAEWLSKNGKRFK